MSESTVNLDATPNLLIVGDWLAAGECGLICHNRDLDHFPTGILKKYSASAEMAIPIIVRLLAVMLTRYPETRNCNPVAKKERAAIVAALRALGPATA